MPWTWFKALTTCRCSVKLGDLFTAGTGGGKLKFGGGWLKSTGGGHGIGSSWTAVEMGGVGDFCCSGETLMIDELI